MGLDDVSIEGDEEFAFKSLLTNGKSEQGKVNELVRVRVVQIN